MGNDVVEKMIAASNLILKRFVILLTIRDHSILMKIYIKPQIEIIRQNLTGKIFLLLAVLLPFIFLSCHQKAPPPKQEIVNTPEQMKETVPDVIKAIVGQVSDNGGKLDTVSILQPEVIRYLYDKNNDEARWSREAKWTPAGSLLIKFIENARLYGLFPEDYHFENISNIN